jgi:hypothetical protein
MILASRTIQSTLESGARAGYDGAKRRKGAKVHAAVDSLGRTNPNICVKGFGADLSTAEGVACDERPTRWASRVHVTPGR